MREQEVFVVDLPCNFDPSVTGSFDAVALLGVCVEFQGVGEYLWIEFVVKL